MRGGGEIAPLAQQSKRPLIGGATAEPLDRFRKQVRPALGRERKQRHAGDEFQIVRRAENRPKVPSLERQDGLRAVQQARAEHGMGQIGARLGEP